MKKMMVIFAIFMLVISAGIIMLLPTNNEQVNAISPQSDLASFLEFEKSITELNNINNNNSTISQLSEISSEEDKTPNIQLDDNKFALKRLIVQGDILDTFGATNKISYNNLHILCYESEKATQYAYEQLSEIPQLNVSIDKIETLQQYAETDYVYTDNYTNWGAECADIGGYRQYLVDNNVSKEIVVVVLDTGINTSHPMFTNRLLTDSSGKIKGYSYFNSTYQYSYNNLSFDVDDPSTTDIDEGDTNKYSFEDDNQHGAHVAGIICDLTPSNVKILPIKIGGHNGSSTSSIMLSAYLRVINIYSKQYNIVCTNLSFTGGGKDGEDDRDTFNEQCYQPLLDLNILPVTAAGNDRYENNIEDLKAVVVSALKKQGNEYSFDKSYSNYGKLIDIAAPGTDILSAAISSTDSACSDTINLQGTSMASPQVAGIVALLYLDPTLPSNFTATYIEQQLYNNSLDLGAPGKDIYYGHGMINLKYFEVENTQTLSFYQNSTLISEYVEYENFDTPFTLDIICSDPTFEIIYTTNDIPSYTNHIDYNDSLNIKKTTSLYAIGLKIVNNQIVERTNLYNISYFYSQTPIEECFTIDGTGRLSNYIGNFKNLTLPSTLNGFPITTLDTSLFSNDSILESISLPPTTKEIAGYAFQNCSNLQYVYAPNVTKVYIAAFDKCNLPFITSDHPTSQTKGGFFPSLTETIGFSFSNNTNLTYIDLQNLTLMGSIGFDFYNCTSLELVNLPNISNISEATFRDCSSLSENFYIGEYVSSIGNYAFRGTNINNFSINSNNKYLYSDGCGIYQQNSLVAFTTANQNINYEIPATVIINNREYSVNTICESVAYGAVFNNLTIPSSITNINKNAFACSQINNLYYNAINCSSSGYYDAEDNMLANPFQNITTIIIGENVYIVPQNLFAGIKFDNVVINSYYTTLSNTCFYNYGPQSIQSLTLNFTNYIDETYLNMLKGSYCTFIYGVDYVYSKSEISSPTSIYYKLNYSSNNGTYYVYSTQPLSNKYLISSSSNKYGTISPSGDTYLDEGQEIVYEFYPITGCYLSAIIVDGVALSSAEIENALIEGYTFTDISSNHSIQAIFEPNTYSIEYKDGQGNTITGLTPTTYTYGTPTTLATPTPPSGYAFVGWYDNINFTGDKITSISATTIGPQVFYAKFINNSFTITVIQSANGTISDAEDVYEYGSNATFRITANNGYSLSQIWVDNQLVESFTNVFTYCYTFENISANHTIKAVFTPALYSITYKDGQGNIITGLTPTTYTYGTPTTLPTPTIPSGYTFAGWYNNIYFSGNKITVISETTIGPQVFYAKFNPNTNTKYIIQHWQESLTQSGKLIGDKYYTLFETDSSKTGTTGTLTSALANSYIGFTALEFDQQTIAGDGSTIVQVLYNRNKYKITLKLPQEGGINSASNPPYGVYGAFITIKVTKVADGYNWSHWESSNPELIPNSNDIYYTFKMPTSELTFIPRATLKEYTISVETSTGGMVTNTNYSSDNILVQHGDTQTFEFIPDEGYEITSVYIDDVDMGTISTYTFEDIISDHKIDVVFSRRSYSITATSNEYGIISPSGILYFSHGEDSVLFSFIPDSNYQVKSVIVDNISIGHPNDYIFTNIISNHTIHVEFEEEKIDVNISCSNNNGYVNYNGEEIVYGENKTFTVTPKEGYKIDQVIVNNESVPFYNNMFTINNIQEDLDIQIKFVKISENPLESLDKKTIALIFGAIFIGLILLIAVIKKVVKK